MIIKEIVKMELENNVKEVICNHYRSKVRWATSKAEEMHRKNDRITYREMCADVEFLRYLESASTLESLMLELDLFEEMRAIQDEEFEEYEARKQAEKRMQELMNK